MNIPTCVAVMIPSKTHQFTGWLRTSALAVVALLAAKAQADVKLPAIFTDNMVLQQGLNTPVWGWADEGETVTIQFRDQRITTKPVNGKWTVKLKPLKAGGPDELVVHGKNRVQLKNVLVGEVWVCSGQSNMEWPLSRSFESQKDIAQSANPNLRLFKVQKAKSDEPLMDLKQPWNVGKFAWQESSSQSSADFSAVGYYFGQALQKARGVPIGLIESDWGGSPAEVWIRKCLKRTLVTRRTFSRSIRWLSKLTKTPWRSTKPPRPLPGSACTVETNRTLQRHDPPDIGLRHRRGHLVSR